MGSCWCKHFIIMALNGEENKIKNRIPPIRTSPCIYQLSQRLFRKEKAYELMRYQTEDRTKSYTHQ
jgi:hypothetical protein